MKAREMARKMADINIEEGDCLVQILIRDDENKERWIGVTDVKVLRFGDTDGQSKVATIMGRLIA